jgi:class 3 adenylate cyclase
MLRRPWWVWCCAGAAVIVVAFGWSSPVIALRPLQSMAYALTLAVILAAGLIAAGSSNQRANGRLMLLIALAVSAYALFYRSEGFWQFVAYILAPAANLLLFILLMRWPRSRLQTRSQRWLAGTALVAVPLVTLADEVCYDPAWDGYPDVWWPSVVPSKELCYALTDVRFGVVLALLAVFLIVLAGRVRWASPPERRELVPVIIAALSLTAANAFSAAYVIADPYTTFDFSMLYYIAWVAVPLSFLVAMLVRRLQRARAVEALLRPELLHSPEAVRQTLAKAMGDDRLGLALYAPEHGGYVDVDGVPAGDIPPDRHGVHVSAADGTPRARIDLHPRLEGRPELTATVVQAAAVALDNARLQAELRAQLREVDESRLRLEEARLEGERLSRLLPGGLAEKLRADPSVADRTESLTVTVLMSDVRGYSGIAERTEPSILAGQLREHRRAMNAAILAEAGTVMQYVGDAVMAVFGAPFPQADHARRALRAAAQMHERQAEVNQRWIAAGLEPFGLGIGVSTGVVAAALLGSEERVEYTVVGDTVNLAHCLQDAARPAGTTVASEATVRRCGELADWTFEEGPPLAMKGRVAPVAAFKARPVAVDGVVGVS